MRTFSRGLVLALALLLVVGCETPVATPASSATASARPTPTPAPSAPPYAYTLVYDEYVGLGNQPLVARAISLNGGAPRNLAVVAALHDALFAIDPRGTALAIYDKLDHHTEHTATWRLRLVDVASRTERDVIPERTDPEATRPWDVGWTPDGKLLLASRQTLDAVDPATGARTPLLRFPDGTLGVTFRDNTHPGLVVSQTVDRYTVYDARDDGVRKVADRPLLGLTSYARRPGTDEVVELVSRFDGTVTFSLLSAGGTRDWTLHGPTVEGVVDLVGTTPAAAYLVWPIAKSDPLAYGVEGTGLVLALHYDGTLETMAGLRHWSPFAPKGVSPDGRALMIPSGDQPADPTTVNELAVCCETRPPRRLLKFGYYDVIGWIPEP